MSTVLAERGVPEREIALITGHAVNSQVSTLAWHYIHIADTASLPRRVEVLASFRPAVPLMSYKVRQFESSLDESRFHL